MMRGRGTGRDASARCLVGLEQKVPPHFFASFTPNDAPFFLPSQIVDLLGLKSLAGERRAAAFEPSPVLPVLGCLLGFIEGLRE